MHSLVEPQLRTELLQMQLDHIELLLAMYSSDGELTMDSRNFHHLEKLRIYLGEENPNDKSLFDGLQLHLKLSLELPQRPQDSICLGIRVPLCSSDLECEVPPPLQVIPERPVWLQRKDFDSLIASMPASSEDILSEAIEHIKTMVSQSMEEENVQISSSPGVSTLVRVWFYFPSLSTREKRNDLVNLAPGYTLSGFVLAGKPGVLCLEGASEDIQAYISDIKRNSWGDIPSFQKKITERFREEDAVHRRFTGMREITDEIEKHGLRGNRGDLSQVEKFLAEAGVAEAFGPVFMQRN